jgi:hypothetical protein
VIKLKLLTSVARYLAVPRELHKGNQCVARRPGQSSSGDSEIIYNGFEDPLTIMRVPRRWIRLCGSLFLLHGVHVEPLFSWLPKNLLSRIAFYEACFIPLWSGNDEIGSGTLGFPTVK